MDISMRNWLRGRFNGSYEAWNRYFFSERALDSLALYRVFFCLVVFLECLSWFPYSEELFSTEGYHFRYWFFSAVLSPLEAKIFVILLAASSLCAAIGFYARFNLVLTFVLYTCLYSVDSLNEKAVETIVIFVLFVLIFSPCHRLYSLDTYVGRIQKKERGSVFFQRILQWEFVQIYFFAGVSKMMVPDWPSGKVFIESLMGRWASDKGVWVSGWIPDWLVRGGGFGTILFELFVGVLLLTRPLRWLGVMLCLGFHVGIELFLDVGFLGYQFLIADIFLFFNSDKVSIFIHEIGAWFGRAVVKISTLVRTAPNQR